MFDIPTKDDLRALLDDRPGAHVSLYMCTEQAGAETQQNPIRLKDLLRRAEETLLEREMRTPDAKELLAPARELLDDTRFWRNRGQGLALFMAPGFFRSYRVPLEFDSLAEVNRRFHIKPLLPLLIGDGRFYVLALSQNQVRLLRGSRYSVQPVQVEDMPNSLAEALGYDELEESFQWRTQTVVPSGGGERSAMFHGHSDSEEDDKARIRRYFHQVDAALNDYLTDHREPVVLAGVEYLHPIYREASTYRYLAEGGITGNPEGLSDRELHERAYALIEPQFTAARDVAYDLYRQLAGNASPQASDDLREIVPAAFYGRIDTLFVVEGHQAWGAFDPESAAIELSSTQRPGDDDLLDVAAAQTFINSGAVFVVPEAEVPSNTPQAAIFRY